MNRRSGRTKETVNEVDNHEINNVVNVSTTDTGLDDSWDRVSDYTFTQPNERNGFSETVVHHDNNPTTIDDFDRNENTSWRNGDSSNGFPEPNIRNRSEGLRIRSKNRRSLSSLIRGRGKTPLIIGAAVVLVCLLAVLIYANADGISNAFSAIGSAIASAVIMGIVVTAIVSFIAGQMRLRLTGRSLLWIFILGAVYSLLKAIIPGMATLAGSVIYALVAIGVGIFLIARIIRG